MAQVINRPTVSPYLNIAQPFGNPALNYYNVVRPQFAFRNAIQRLEMGERADQNTLADLQVGTNQLPGTGTRAGFLTHQAYFGTFEPNRPGQGRTLPAATFARPKAASTGTSYR
jgi:hypothetical protein